MSIPIENQVPSLDNKLMYNNMDRPVKVVSYDKVTSGRWGADEHARFVDGLKKFGPEWKAVADYVQTRTISQVRSHAQKYFAKLKKSQTTDLLSVNGIPRNGRKQPMHHRMQEETVSMMNNEQNVVSIANKEIEKPFPIHVLELLQKRDLLYLEQEESEAKMEHQNLTNHDLALFTTIRNNFNNPNISVDIKKEVASWVLHSMENQPSLQSSDILKFILAVFPGLKSCEVIPYNRLTTQEMDIGELERKFKESMTQKSESKELSEDEKKGVSLLASLNKVKQPVQSNQQELSGKRAQGSVELVQQSSEPGSQYSSVYSSTGVNGQNSPCYPPLHPSIPLTFVTLRKRDLIAYANQSYTMDRPKSVDSSQVLISFPVLNDPSCVKYQRNPVEMKNKPLGVLVSPSTNEPMGYLIPAVSNELNAPHAVLFPSSQRSSFSYNTYTLSLPIKDNRES